MEYSDFLLRLLAAVAAGGIVGLERQISNKNAGFRTNTLVAVGSAIFVSISLKLTHNQGDATRIIGQIVTGIGFLGAGVIMHKGFNVQGLTTAATIWCSAALGCLAGLGIFVELFTATILIIIINTSFKVADRWIVTENKKQKSKKVEDSDIDNPDENL